MKSAPKLLKYETNIFAYFSQMAFQTKSVNLYNFLRVKEHQTLHLPSFFEIFYQNLVNREVWAPQLLNELVSFLEPFHKRTYDIQTDVQVSLGATTTLNSIFGAYISQGDEAIVLDPSFDQYRPQIEFAGGKVFGIPMIKSQPQPRAQLKLRGPGYRFDQRYDNWEIDFNRLEDQINKKTKLIVINSPNNPMGKIISQEELDNLGEILKRHPEIVVVEDSAYQHIAFEPYQPFQLPLAINTESLKDRTINVSSAGKLFSSTGLRIGWALGNQELIKPVKQYNQYTVFCLNEPFQIAVAKSIALCKQNNYFKEIRDLYQNQCSMLVDSLVESQLDLDIFIPQGGYFILTDIGRIKVPQKYFKEIPGIGMNKGLAFCHWICDEFKVIAIPISTFYDEQDRSQGDNLVRWAFCKTEQEIKEAGNRLRVQ